MTEWEWKEVYMVGELPPCSKCGHIWVPGDEGFKDGKDIICLFCKSRKVKGYKRYERLVDIFKEKV